MSTKPVASGKPVINFIVLAEDDEDDQIVFTQVIKDLNPQIKVDHVTDGIKLMNLLSNFLPDLLFLDLDMPRKNGLECLLQIKNDPGMKELPVIVFSSTSRPANVQTAYEVGAHLFLIKSSLYQEYLASLKTILEMDWSDPEAIREKYCYGGHYATFS
jgi:CheY-like chemotaxis protein